MGLFGQGYRFEHGGLCNCNLGFPPLLNELILHLKAKNICNFVCKRAETGQLNFSERNNVSTLIKGSQRQCTSLLFFNLVYRCIPLEVSKGDRSISAIYNWFEKIIISLYRFEP